MGWHVMAVFRLAHFNPKRWVSQGLEGTIAVFLCVMIAACGGQAQTSSPESTPTPTASVTHEPLPAFQPTEKPEPTSSPQPPTPTPPENTPTPTPIPQEKPLVPKGIKAFGFEGPRADEGPLAGFEVQRKPVNVSSFISRNSGLRPLVDERNEQYFAVLKNKNTGQVFLADFSIPQYPAGAASLEFNPLKLTTILRDENGRAYYHLNLLGVNTEGYQTIIYLNREGNLRRAVINENGEIISGTEQNYWEEMPANAADVLLAEDGGKYDVVFISRDGGVLERRELRAETLPLPVCELTSRGEVVNVRRGPGTEYPVVSGLKPGLKLEVKYKSPDGKWVSGELVDERGNVIAKDVWVTADPGLTKASCSLDSVAVAREVPPTPSPAEAKKGPEVEVGREYTLLRNIDVLKVNNVAKKSSYIAAGKRVRVERIEGDTAIVVPVGVPVVTEAVVKIDDLRLALQAPPPVEQAPAAIISRTPKGRQGVYIRPNGKEWRMITTADLVGEVGRAADPFLEGALRRLGKEMPNPHWEFSATLGKVNYSQRQLEIIFQGKSYLVSVKDTVFFLLDGDRPPTDWFIAVDMRNFQPGDRVRIQCPSESLGEITSMWAVR